MVTGNTIEIKNFLSESGASLSGTEGEAVGPGITNFFPVYLTYSGSYSPTPITLIEEASYEFTPYDPILPALTGSSLSGALALDFVQATAETDTGTLGHIALTFSGNSPGIYWDIADGATSVSIKEKADEYGYLAHDIEANPLLAHNLSLSAWFKGNSGEYKKITEISLPITAETPRLDVTNFAAEESTRVRANLRTNALPQYGNLYDATLTQTGGIFTGTVNVSATGEMETLFDGIDVSETSSIQIAAKNASGSILVQTGWTIPGE